jgi:5,10-methenyltetrahydrofolate synthetase
LRSDLRSRLVASREALSEAEHSAASRRLERHLEALLARLRPERIGFCWPFRAEFDCRALVTRHILRGCRAALPVVVASHSPMIFREWRPESEMVVDRYGIRIPAAGSTLQPDLVLMPVNAFDEAGYRLGYGGGYFDRTLAALDLRPVTVGVGFELARVESIEPQPHDVPLDYLVTEAGCAHLGPTGWISLSGLA